MYHFIVNPNARSGLGQKVWKDLEIILKTRNIDYKVYLQNIKSTLQQLPVKLPLTEMNIQLLHSVVTVPSTRL